MRRLAAVVAAVCLSLLAAGCGGNSVQDPSEDVPFTACSQVECAGRLPSGADFDIILPTSWNGTLAIFSHGEAAPGRKDQAAAPGSSSSPSEVPGSEPGGDAEGTEAASTPPAEPDPGREPDSTVSPRAGGPELAPLWRQGERAVADVMLQAGYAIAGTAPSESGWSVPEQVTAAEELHEYFTDTIGDPNRVYVWGEANGGLASARIAEEHPDWVSGALALCAPLSGPVRTYNLALDVAYAVRQLLDPALKLSGYTSVDEAREANRRAAKLVRRAATGSRAEQAKIVFIGAVGVLPTHSRTHDGRTLSSQIQANIAGIENLLRQATVERYELEQEAQGNPSGNAGTDYALRISEPQRAQIDSLVPGITARYLERLNPDRISADPAAAERAAELGQPTGELEVPLLTVHNVFDPVFVIQNQSSYAATLAAVGPEAQGQFVNLTVFPPSAYDENNPAPEGAGNCNFEPRTLFGALVMLNRWVRGGEYPGQDSLAETFQGQRVAIDYEPPPWPQMSSTAPPSDSASAGAVRPSRRSIVRGDDAGRARSPGARAR